MVLPRVLVDVVFSAQFVLSALVGPNVSRHVPTVGNYSGPYRPQIHFSPPRNFMNDPNGLFRDANGTWHLYYQYNPTNVTAENQHWGHATSLDLYHWINQPIALFPPKPNVLVFSGSIVIDSENTSGFFPNQNNGVVAIYTLATFNARGDAGPEQQAISFSHDGGYTFTPYHDNPVIPSNSSQFRDPKVIRHGGQWVMAVAYPVDFAVGIFVSSNLIDWKPVSNFSRTALLGEQWECPNLVPMPYVDEMGVKRHDMWLMFVSVNPGAPLGGSISQYFPGTFNGSHFNAVDSVTRLTDFGKDNYAGQFFYGVPENEDPVLIAWASNWQYTELVPTDQEGWRSAMSLPRRMHLIKAKSSDWKLATEPYDLTPVQGEVLASTDKLQNTVFSLDFGNLSSNALYWEANVTGIPHEGIPAEAVFNVSFETSDTTERLSTWYSFGDGTFSIDRGQTQGFNFSSFTTKVSTRSLWREQEWSMKGVIDRSVVEVFLNHGIDSATMTFFTKQRLTRMVVESAHLSEEMRVSVIVRALNSVWEETARGKAGS